jgi:N4-gp56 family major capsid protein
MALYDNLNKTYSAGVASEITEYIQRKAETNITPMLIHLRDAQVRPFPMNSGMTANFRKFTELAARLTPIAEGVTPTGQLLTQTTYSAMLQSYGGHIELTKEMIYYALSNMTREASRLLNNQAALTLDTLAANAFSAGLNVQYAGGNTVRGTIAATDKLTYAEIKEAVRTLELANIPTFPDGSYHAIVHPRTEFDITADTLFTDTSKYQNQTKIERYELGKIWNTRLFKSTNAKVFTVESYVYGTTASLVASANFDATNGIFTYSAAVTVDEAREMTGKMVNVQYTDGSNYVYPMTIMSVNPTTKQIKFRWQPATSVTDNWTTAKTLTIVPLGAGAASVPVYSTLVYGPDAFGTIKLDSHGNLHTEVVPPGGHDDLYHQKGAVVWYVDGFCAVIINQDAVVRIESGATA